MRGNVDNLVLRKILNYCELINKSINGHNESYEAFLENQEFFAAVSMFQMQIGEVAKYLSNEFTENTKAEIPWKDIKNMRNFFAHVYDDLDPQKVWNTAVNDIPVLKSFCEEYLKENS
ncbi:MAG: DUF86 domain-containing protein [Ruminococcus sp.]|jgi:uncharacterized protein with HEPN domain|nr:DUF86 domain-containing protein [Ruminococcus sp.]